MSRTKKAIAENQQRSNTPNDRGWDTLLSLKDIQYLSLQESYFPVKNRPYDFHQIKAKVPTSYVPSVLMPSFPFEEIQASANDELISFPGKRAETSLMDESTRVKSGATFRPRAVVSSAENDALIGLMNKTEEVRHFAKHKPESRNRALPPRLKTSFVNGKDAKKKAKSITHVVERTISEASACHQQKKMLQSFKLSENLRKQT